MTTAAYANECGRLASGLIGETTESDIEQLRAEFANEQLADWVLWCVSNRKEICAMLAAAPSKRRRRKCWRDPLSGPRFRLACIQYALHGAAVLVAVDVYRLSPSPPETGYRAMVATAGDAYLDLYRAGMFLWPFGDPVPREWASVSLKPPCSG